jgi:hypothetical protein
MVNVYVTPLKVVGRRGIVGHVAADRSVPERSGRGRTEHHHSCDHDRE